MAACELLYDYFYKGLNMKNNILLSLALGICFGSILYSFMPFHADPVTTEKAAPIPPAVGSLWEAKSGDPFPSNGPAIKVLEIRSGWVRYYVCSTMPDERCRVEVFLTLYRPNK